MAAAAAAPAHLPITHSLVGGGEWRVVTITIAAFDRSTDRLRNGDHCIRRAEGREQTGYGNGLAIVYRVRVGAFKYVNYRDQPKV